MSAGWKETLWTSWWPPTFPPCSSWPSPRSPFTLRMNTSRPVFLLRSHLSWVFFSINKIVWEPNASKLVSSDVHTLHIGVKVLAADLVHEGHRVVAPFPHPRPAHHLCRALPSGNNRQQVLPANSFFQEHTAKHMERQGLRWFLIDVCVPYYVAFGEVVLPFVISSFVIVYAFIMLMHYYEVMYSRWPGCSYFGDKWNMLHQWTRCKNYRLQIARNSQTQVCITKNVQLCIEW